MVSLAKVELYCCNGDEWKNTPPSFLFVDLLTVGISIKYKLWGRDIVERMRERRRLVAALRKETRPFVVGGCRPSRWPMSSRLLKCKVVEGGGYDGDSSMTRRPVIVFFLFYTCRRLSGDQRIL